MVALTLPYTKLLKKKACRVFDLASLSPLCAHICPTMTYPPQHPDFPAFAQGSTINLHQSHLLKIHITDECIERIWYVYTREYYLAKKKKKEQNNAICRNMDGSRDYHTKQSNPDKDKSMISLIWGIWKINELIYKTKQTQRQKRIYGCQRGKGRGGIN